MNSRKIPVSKLVDGNRLVTTDIIASETLIKLSFNGQNIANLLASPDDCSYLLKGHLVSEGYLDLSLSSDDNEIFVDYGGSGEILVKMSSDKKLNFKSKSPILTTTSCGACNIDGLDILLNNLPPVKRFDNFNPEILFNGLELMKTNQKGFSMTGGMHCSGLLSSQGELLHYCEDIGRHNSVDKVIGKALGHVELNNTILLLSGRCGWDIVAKAARCNIGNIASIGACSTMAADCARNLGIRLFCFVKENSATIIG